MSDEFFEEVTIKPQSFPLLYSRTSNGSIQTWQIFVDGDSFFTIEGILGGKLTESKKTFVESKNLGKKNQSLGYMQAIKEATSKYNKKIESGYRLNINDIDISTFFEPMLAKKYGEVDFQFPIYQQFKLDGLRCIITKNGMFSRNGKPIVSAPHIFEELKSLFIENPDLVFDGELYNHRYKHNFNKIISLAKKSKPTKEDLLESKKLLQYHVYDFPLNNKFTFGSRWIRLIDLLKNNKIDSRIIVPVKTMFVETQEELDDLYTTSLTEGYEGQMIRLDCPYENKRSKYLLKRKEFIDKEFILLDITEGKGQRSGMFGRGHFKTEDGKDFEANARGDEEFYIELLKNKQNYIGKLCTVRYQNLTPDNIPRFPVITNFDRDDI